MNSREAISARKCEPPFLTQVSVRFRALSWVFGFLLPMRRLRDLMASLGATVLDRMISEISRFRAISSKLLLVAFTICSSKAVLAEDDHQLIMVGNGRRLIGRGRRGRGQLATEEAGDDLRKIKGARVLTPRVAWRPGDGDDGWSRLKLGG